MANNKSWKTCTVYGPGSILYRSSKSYRTDGTVYQVWESRSVDRPEDSDLLEWTQDALKSAEGLVEPKLSFYSDVVGGDEYTDAYAEANCYVSGWREASVEEVKTAKTLTFN